MQEQPPKYVSPPGTWRAKLGLRIASVVCLVIIAALGGSLATTPRVDDMTWIMGLAFAPALVLTFIWDVAEAISIVKRGGNRGIHPGAVVAVDLILWLGWAIVDLVMLTSGLVLRARYLIQDYSGYDDYHYTYNTSKVTAADAALEKVIAGKGRAMFAFGIFTLIIHFVLFVIACTETNKRNRMPRTVYVMQPMYGPPQVIVPAAYQQLGAYPPQPQPGQPYPPNQMYMPPPGQMPAQPPPATVAPETKTTGAERFA